jgi:hypothetical protein
MASGIASDGAEAGLDGGVGRKATHASARSRMRSESPARVRRIDERSFQAADACSFPRKEAPGQ